jgi:hypothetical protein
MGFDGDAGGGMEPLGHVDVNAPDKIGHAAKSRSQALQNLLLAKRTVREIP